MGLDFNTQLYQSAIEVWKSQKSKADVNNHWVYIYAYENIFMNFSTMQIQMIEIVL